MSEIAPLDELPTIGLLKELDQKVRRAMARAGRCEILLPETQLATQGTQATTFAILLSGKASVYCHAHGDYIHVADIKPGETIGEMNLIDPHLSSADVTITEKSTVWIMDVIEFQTMVERDAETAYVVMAWLARELCRRLRRNSDHMLRQASELRSHMRDVDY
jgi:CRP-like cAMP-binding protein